MNEAAALTQKQLTGRSAYLAGLAAEDMVARSYERQGFKVVSQRWRARGAGEVDLIVESPSAVVVIEVKKSQSHARAAARVTPRQLARISHTAEAAYLSTPEWMHKDLRIDLATVDQNGGIEIRENITMH